MEEKIQISFWATPEELASIERIMKHFSRSTRADAIRFLVLEADKKILDKKVAMANAGCVR